MLDRLQDNRLVATSVAASLALHAAALGLGPQPAAYTPPRVLSVVLERIRAPEPLVEAPSPALAPPPPVAQPRPKPRRERPAAVAPAPPAPSVPDRMAAPAPTPDVPPATPKREESPSAPPAVASSAPAPQPVSPPDFRAAYLNNPPPPYPRAARRNGEEGTAVLRVLVDASGTAARVELERSSGSNMLDAAATAAVKNWRFAPATRGGTPIAAWVIVPMVFRLAPES